MPEPPWTSAQCLSSTFMCWNRGSRPAGLRQRQRAKQLPPGMALVLGHLAQPNFIRYGPPIAAARKGPTGGQCAQSPSLLRQRACPARAAEALAVWRAFPPEAGKPTPAALPLPPCASGACAEGLEATDHPCVDHLMLFCGNSISSHWRGPLLTGSPALVGILDKR